MKKEEIQRYIYLALSGFLAIALSIAFFFFLYKISELQGYTRTIVNALMPFVYGGVLAYLLIPVAERIETAISPLLGQKYHKVTRGIGIFASLFLFAAILYLLLAMVVPQVINSLVSLAYSLPGAVNKTSAWVEETMQKNKFLQGYAESLIEEGTSWLENWIRTSLLPSVQTLITGLSSSVFRTINIVIDILIGIVVCIYIMAGRDQLVRQGRLILHSILPKKQGNIVSELIEETDKCFGGFIRGKLVDSLIIGVLCFIGLNVFNIGNPYIMLVSVIVGVTNIIPFFGPYIGAVPSALLIFIVDPMQCLYFLIFILVLQQLDGNIIGPAILGGTTALNSFWVLFSILFFGQIFGFVGMIIGVPLFSIIYFIITKLVFKLLRKKNLTYEIEEYREVYPDKRKDRDEKQLQRELKKAERESKKKNKNKDE